MKLIKKAGLSTVLLLIPSLYLTAQTVNTGEMVIMPNTQVGVENNFSNTISGNLLHDGELFVYANLNNDGTIDFLSEGLTRFQGSLAQEISGNAQSYFYNVLFDNNSESAPFYLSGSISIDNESDFTQGIVDNDTYGGNITYQQYADHVGANDDSHVDGEVVKIGDNEFEFPLGDAGFYRPAIITAPDNATDAYTGHYILQNSDGPTSPHNLAAGVILQIDNTEYWTIERTAGNSNVVLTLGWDEDTSPEFITNANPEHIHIVRWDAENNFWKSEGGIPDADNQTVTTIANVEGYGIFTLALIKPEVVLPDDLVIYTAVSPNGNGQNDFFFIDGIDRYPNNSVKIFNRWGVEVFSTRGYNETNNVFRGYSDGRLTINDSESLPTGTYYYILEYEFPGNETVSPQMVKKAGFLYITTDN
jgi:gliding motility-associated-like protein